MSKPSEKKRQKKKAREKAEAQKQVVAERRRRYKQDFPEFVYRTNGAPQGWVNAVRDAVKSLDFRDRDLFPDMQATLYKAAKVFGGQVLQIPAAMNGRSGSAGLMLSISLGQLVFSRIRNLLNWIPFNDVQFLPTGKRIVVVFRSLLSASGRGGKTYYSRYTPTLEIDGEKKIVGFSDHAIQRACDRVVPTWRTYTGLGDAFALFDQCIHFERADFYNGDLAFTFFDTCAQGYFSGVYVDEVLGGWNGTREGYYYRVGYCPAVIEGDFIKATTFGRGLESAVVFGRAVARAI